MEKKSVIGSQAKKTFSIKSSHIEFRYVLFDYDGVIGDTMEDNYAAWSQAFKKYGVAIKRKEYFLLEGRGVRDIVRTLGREHKVSPIHYAKILADKESHYLAHNSFGFYKGVKELVVLLKKQGIVLGIISGAARSRLFKTLPKDFIKQFSAVVTSESVRRTKPYPDAYLQGLKQLKAKKWETLVIENAPLGIQSAKKARLHCVAVTTTLPKRYLFQADLIVKNMEELAKQIKFKD
jgi:beta-phosphoglucomutase